MVLEWSMSSTGRNTPRLRARLQHEPPHANSSAGHGRAPLTRAYKRRMGWNFRWVSSLGSSFNYDFHVTIDPAVAPVEHNYKDQAQLEAENVAWRDWSGEQPGMSAFARDGDDVFHTCSAYSRGFDGLWTMWQWLDRAPLGRNEDDRWSHRRACSPTTGSKKPLPEHILPP